METTTMTGEYYLRGMHEMASGFLLKPGGEFQFFFTYGSLDRFASGKWTTKGNELILNSGAKPPHDFKLIESKTGGGDMITIRIKDNNPNLLKHVYGSLEEGIEGSWLPANEQGLISFPKQEFQTISLLFEFCPERFSTFTIEDKKHNDFSFRFEPWIVEAFLVDFKLKITEEGLFGGHPLLEGEEYTYQKS